MGHPEILTLSRSKAAEPAEEEVLLVTVAAVILRNLTL